MEALLAIADQTPYAGSADSRAPEVEFGALYETEYAAMVRLARGMVDTTERAEEIVQEAFAKVLQRWATLDNPGGYLRMCVVNGSRSELRKREVRRRIHAQRSADPVDSSDNEYLFDALAQLAPKRRVALVLRFYGDHSEKEIAELMGVRPGTVKSLVSRGLADLRKVIER